jgi:hypothetical protein
MRFRSAGALTPDAIGARVTVRRRLDDGRASDVVGVLLAIDDESVTVRDRHGDAVRIARIEIVASRVISRA